MRTRFYPKNLLFVIEIPRDHTLPTEFLQQLRQDGYIHSFCAKSDFGGRTLLVYLAKRDNLPDGTLLASLALHISRLPGYRAVADPVEVGGRPINFARVIKMLGEILASYREVNPGSPLAPRPTRSAA